MARGKKSEREWHKEALHSERILFTAARIREVKEKTGWTHERVREELFKPIEPGAPGERAQSKGLPMRSSESYKRYLLPPSNPKARGLLAGHIQTLENRVAELVGRPARTVVVQNFTELMTGPGWRGGPPSDFLNAGTPGEIDLRGVPSNHVGLGYRSPDAEHEYLLALVAQAEVWPRLAGMFQYDSDEDLNKQAWLLLWQKRIQSARVKVDVDSWQQYWGRLPRDFQAICDAPAGTLPVIPPTRPVPRPSRVDRTRWLLRQMQKLKRDGNSAGNLPETTRNPW